MLKSINFVGGRVVNTIVQQKVGTSARIKQIAVLLILANGIFFDQIYELCKLGIFQLLKKGF